MCRLRPWLSVFALLLPPVTPLIAQHPSVGILVGRSFVGGGDSRTLVGPGVTGGDQAGLVSTCAPSPICRSSPARSASGPSSSITD
jgi:hypothetical protein